MTTSGQELANLFGSFEECRFEHDGIEAWRARDLMPMLGYKAWQDFRNAIQRAWTSCENTDNDASLHFLNSDGLTPWHPNEVFRDVPKNPQGGRPSEDVILTRRAAYLVAMNGDPRKTAVAFAQHYFATATRSLELLQQRLVEAQRLTARGELSDTEARFQGVLYEHGVDGQGIGRIRSRGDKTLFGHDTQTMKTKWGIKGNRPLADFAPEVVIRAKQLGAAMTTHNVRTNNLRGEVDISDEHVINNETVRETLLSRGIRPEALPPRRRYQEDRASPRGRSQEAR